MSRFLAAALALLAVLAGAEPARADSLKDIIARGVVRIGVPYDVPPYGFLDNERNPTGYSVEVARLMAKALNLKIELQQVTSANRIAYLASGRIDIVVTNLGLTPERATQVLFSAPYVTSVLGVFGPKNIKIEGMKDFGNRRISLAKGTASDSILSEVTPKLNLLRAEDDPTANMMYATGQAEFWATGTTIVASVAARNPNKEYELKLTLRESPSHIAVPMGEHNLLRWVNSFLFAQKLNGEFDRLSLQFLNEPLRAMPPL